MAGQRERGGQDEHGECCGEQGGRKGRGLLTSPMLEETM